MEGLQSERERIEAINLQPGEYRAIGGCQSSQGPQREALSQVV